VVDAKNSGKKAEDIAPLIVKHSLEKGSLDNVTTIVIEFEHS
jgi:hypothetical protein